MPCLVVGLDALDGEMHGAVVALFRQIDELCQPQPQVRLETSRALGESILQQPGEDGLDVAVTPERRGHQPVGQCPVSRIAHVVVGKRDEVGPRQNFGKPPRAALPQRETGLALLWQGGG